MSELSPQAIRAEALEALLVEQGLLDEAQIDQTIQFYNERVGPMNGARVVARAWLDENFRARLLEDATAAIEEFDFQGGEVQKLVVYRKLRQGGVRRSEGEAVTFVPLVGRHGWDKEA